MSRDSKNCRIVERCSIEKILLIEQYWVRLCDEIMWEDNGEEMSRVEDR